MRRAASISLIAGAGVIAVAIATLVALPRFIDAERRGLIEQRASTAIGREVTIGAIGVSLFPGVALRADGLEIAGSREDGAAELLVAESLRLDAALLPLLRGRLEVGAVEIDRAKLHLVRDESGRWNVARLIEERRNARDRDDRRRRSDRADGGAGAADAGEGAAPSNLVIDRIELTQAQVAIEDRSVSPALDLVLEPLDLELDDLSTGGSFALSFATGFGGSDRARLLWSGAAGPLGRNKDDPFAVQGKASIEQLAPDLLAAIARLAGFDLAALDERLAPVSGTIDVDAAFPQRATLSGDLDFGQVRVALPSTGEPREVSVDVATRFEVATERGADRVRIAQLAIDLDDTRLELDGVLERMSPESRRVELALHPARIDADRLGAFLSVAMPDLPFSFSSRQPLEIEAKIHGVLGPDQRPGIDGRARLDDVRFDHQGMTLPIEHLSAQLELSGQSLTATGFEAVLGETDLRGELQVEDFARPRVRFDLDSRRANLDQLFGALATDEPASAGGEDARGDDLLERINASGRIHVDQATWGDLEASDLDATLRLTDGTVTLEPLTAALYAGRFDGRIDAWPARSPLPFRVEGKAEGVRVERFLEGALGIEDRVTGRFSGTLRADGSAGEWAEVARSLEGRGAMRIEDGEVESFPLLRSVATLSGVLGEDGLAKIASRLAQSATRFSVLSGEFRLEGGDLRFDPIVLQSSDFTLRGTGAVDLVAAAIDGRGSMAFSPEISELMRLEDSRAAEVFWSEGPTRSAEGERGGGHVNLPLSLRGLLSEPTALVDWEVAARSYAERRLGREVERQVGKILGRLLGGDPTPTPQPPSQ